MINFKTAKELKSIADSHSKSNVIFENIIAAALEAANEGECCISYDAGGFQYHILDDLRKEVMEKLVELGYSCAHNTFKFNYGDQSYLLVSWEK